MVVLVVVVMVMVMVGGDSWGLRLRWTEWRSGPRPPTCSSWCRSAVLQKGLIVVVFCCTC